MINRAKLYALYEKLPYLKGILDEIHQQRLLDKLQIRNAYLRQDATSRYRLFLQHQPGIATRVQLRDIASYLDITPQSLSRIRRKFRLS